MNVNGVDANGVSQQVIDALQATTTNPRINLLLNMAVSQRDAEYIVECLRILLQEERIAQTMVLSLNFDEISDQAIDVFARFFRESHCHLHALCLWNLPPRQARHLLAALRTNRFVKKLYICKLRDDNGASWIVDLLRHKTDFTHVRFYRCGFPFTQILPLLGHGQPNLTSLAFDDCRISSSSNGLNLFSDPESTQLFVDNVLLSPLASLKRFVIANCGVSVDNRLLLMVGFHKNTTIVEPWTNNAEINRFLYPIARRNRNLVHLHGGMLGTTSYSSASSTTSSLSETTTTRIIPPPPCSLWPTVLAKVGQGNSQGETPVYTILCNRLATWICP
jgi:hypothetical protein